MKISILGCGWLGQPLALNLLESNHQVKGSTTTQSKITKLKKAGIDPYLIELNPELKCKDCESFWDSDVLVLNIPPGRGRDNITDYHSAQIQAVIDRLGSSPINQVVFVSSTSVYPELPGVVVETDAIEGKAGRDSGNALIEAEKMLAQEKSFETTVLRFGGLYGYDRHPAKYLSGKENLDKARAPINLIHQDDCIQIIKKIIEDNITGEVFNAVADGHPPRELYYTEAAKAMDLEPPTFRKDNKSNYKVVSNRKLKEKLHYRFKYPNPIHFKS